MKYSNYKLDDFLADELFRNWVINPNEESDYFWASFIENNPDKYPTVIEAKEIILSLKPAHVEKKLDSDEVEALFESILNDDTPTEKPVQGKSKISSQHFMSQFLKVAAIVIVTSVLGFAWFLQQQPPQSESFQMVVKETLPGEKKTIRLPDNSTVILNSNSRIEYSIPFINDDRRVRLNGEAFFDIAEDESRPFIVSSGQHYTKVLGTSFVIKKVLDGETLDVSVLEGKVEVGHVSAQNEIIRVELMAEEKVMFESNEFKRLPFNYKSQFAWKDGTLYFDKSDFNDVMARLENWYGVEFEIKKSFDRKKDFSGEFTNQSMDLVLEGIGFVYGFEYLINENTVIIY